MREGLVWSSEGLFVCERVWCGLVRVYLCERGSGVDWVGLFVCERVWCGLVRVYLCVRGSGVV